MVFLGGAIERKWVGFCGQLGCLIEVICPNGRPELGVSFGSCCEQREKSVWWNRMEEGSIAYRPVAKWDTDEVVSWMRGMCFTTWLKETLVYGNLRFS